MRSAASSQFTFDGGLVVPQPVYKGMRWTSVAPNVFSHGGVAEAVAVDRLLPNMVAMLRALRRVGTWASMPGSATLVIAVIDGALCPRARVANAIKNTMCRILLSPLMISYL